MIFGLGTDIVAMARFEALFARHGERLARRVLCDAERADFVASANPARFLAKRFAAKEAFGKALGTGLRAPALLTHIGVGHDALGKPCFVYAPVLEQHLARLQLTAHLSLSDERDYVVAFAILEQRRHDTP